MDGGSFREARERAGLSLEELSQALDVREEYLQALERGELGRLLGPSYVQSIAVRYAAGVGWIRRWFSRPVTKRRSLNPRRTIGVVPVGSIEGRRSPRRGNVVHSVRYSSRCCWSGSLSPRWPFWSRCRSSA